MVITGVGKFFHNTLRKMESLLSLKFLPGPYKMTHISEAEDFVKIFC